MSKTQLAFLVVLNLILLFGLLLSRTEKLTDDVWAVELVDRCFLDYHTSSQSVALACPGVDYIRLWPRCPSSEPGRSLKLPPSLYLAGLRREMLNLFPVL